MGRWMFTWTGIGWTVIAAVQRPRCWWVTWIYDASGTVLLSGFMMSWSGSVVHSVPSTSVSIEGWSSLRSVNNWEEKSTSVFLLHVYTIFTRSFTFSFKNLKCSCTPVTPRLVTGISTEWLWIKVEFCNVGEEMSLAVWRCTLLQVFKEQRNFKNVKFKFKMFLLC